MAVRRLRVVWMSRTCGMFSKMTGSSVRRAAAMQGRAAFFAPLTRTVPRSGSPPRITNLSMGESRTAIVAGRGPRNCCLGWHGFLPRRKTINHKRSTTEDTGGNPTSRERPEKWGNRQPEIGRWKVRIPTPRSRFSLLRLGYGDGLADVAFCFFQGGGRLGAGCVGGKHYYGYGSAISCGFKGVSRGGVIGSGGLFDNPNGALD